MLNTSPEAGGLGSSYFSPSHLERQLCGPSLLAGLGGGHPCACRDFGTVVLLPHT